MRGGDLVGDVLRGPGSRSPLHALRLGTFRRSSSRRSGSGSASSNAARGHGVFAADAMARLTGRPGVGRSLPAPASRTR